MEKLDEKPFIHYPTEELVCLKDKRQIPVNSLVFKIPTQPKLVRKKIQAKTMAMKKETKPKTEKQCLLCHGAHYLSQCESFLFFNTESRYEFTMDQRICLRCLNKGHKAGECKVKFTCDVNNCGKHHHRLLHFEKQSKVILESHRLNGTLSDLL